MRAADQAPVASAADRILLALATEFPRLHNRATLLGSAALADCGPAGGAAGDRATLGAALDQLIGDESLAEVLLPRRYSEHALLPERGIIAVSVDLRSMREACLSATREPDAQPPTQEAILAEILDRSRQWILDHLDGTRPPLAVTGACMIHGSRDFDFLVNISYQHPYNLLLYTREVIQGVDHVAGTQTLLVAKIIGFPNF